MRTSSHDQRFVFNNLNTHGLGPDRPRDHPARRRASLIAGNTFGRVIAIVGGVLGALGALFSIGGGNPWWSLAVFALCVYIVHGVTCSVRTSGAGIA